MPATVAVRPPEYFARLAYLALVQAADVFVLADTFRYSKRSDQNRARLRTPQGWQWISVPLQAHQGGRPIRAVALENRERWLVKHWRSFQYNYRTTPYFEFYEPEVAPFFERTWERLGPLACASVELQHRLLGLDTRLVRASELPGAPATRPAVLEAVGAQALLTLPDAGARRVDGRDAISMKTHVLRFDLPAYRQNFEGFEQGMAAADLLFNYGPEAARMIARPARLEPLP